MSRNRNQMRERRNPGHRSDAIPGGLIGAILIHVFAFMLAFAKGFFFGETLPLGHGPAPADGFTGGEYGGSCHWLLWSGRSELWQRTSAIDTCTFRYG